MLLCKARSFWERFFEELRARSQKCRLIDALNCSTCLQRRGRFLIYLSRLSIFLSRMTRSNRSRLSSSFRARSRWPHATKPKRLMRSEEHTSELQSHHDLVCRLLLEKK